MEFYPPIEFVSDEHIRQFLAGHDDELRLLFTLAVKNALAKSSGKKNVYISYLRTGLLLNDDLFLITSTDEKKPYDLYPFNLKLSVPFINKYIYDLVSVQSAESLLQKKATGAEVDFYRIDLFERIAYILFNVLAKIFDAQDYNSETDYVLYYGEYLGAYRPLTLMQAGE